MPFHIMMYHKIPLELWLICQASSIDINTHILHIKSVKVSKAMAALIAVLCIIWHAQPLTWTEGDTAFTFIIIEFLFLKYCPY